MIVVRLLGGAALAGLVLVLVVVGHRWVERVTRDRFWPTVLVAVFGLAPVGLCLWDWAVAAGFVAPAVLAVGGLARLYATAGTKR